MTSLPVHRPLISALAVAASFAAGGALADDRATEPALEFPVETEALVAATAALFDEVEAREVDSPDRVPVIRLPQLAQKVRAEAPAARAPLTLHGPLRHLTGYRINWYPTERFLGAVDFMGTWDGNRNLVCGYLIWDLSDPGTPVLDRVHASYVELGDLVGASSEEVHEALLEANCAYGTIEANYSFFDVAG